MKNERPYAEHLPSTSANRAPSPLDSEAESSFPAVGDKHQELGRDTDWDNWKSVRDVA